MTKAALRMTAVLAAMSATLGAQNPPRQTEADAYTRYELLAPGSAKFRIIYEVTATTAGATHPTDRAGLSSVRPGCSPRVLPA